jgi:hypothetical protein
LERVVLRLRGEIRGRSFFGRVEVPEEDLSQIHADCGSPLTLCSIKGGANKARRVVYVFLDVLPLLYPCSLAQIIPPVIVANAIAVIYGFRWPRSGLQQPREAMC